MARDLATGLGGILFFGITILALVVPPPPHPEPAEGLAGDAAAAWLVETRLLHDWQATVHAVGAAALLVFAWGLAQRTRAAPASSLVLASGAATATFLVVAMGIVLIGNELAEYHPGTGDLALGLYAAGWYFHFQGAALAAVLLGAAGAAVAATGALARWVAWSAYALAALHLVAVASTLLGFGWLVFPTFLAFLVWSLAVGVVALVRPAPVTA